MAAGNYDCLLKEEAKALVNALQEEAFEMAEKLIRNIRDPRCLNGTTDRPSPLTLVLTGKAGYLNLHLAALLVQYGADPNLRNTHLSPLEYVIELYQDSKALCDKQKPSYFQLPELKLIIGLHGEINPPPLKLKEQAMELLDMLLTSGANPNLVTGFRLTMFHKVVGFENPDNEVVMKLHQWGGNWNARDIYGTTPLMYYVYNTSRDRGFPLVDKILCEGIGLNLNNMNHYEETVLCHAMLAGSPATAVLLLQNGADPTIAARHPHTPVSPIFAPLLRISVLYSSLSSRSFSVEGLNKVMLCSVFPVVDCTDICDSVCENIECVLSKTDFPMPCLTDQGNCPRDVALLMLGHLKAGLQQLCVRRIMEHLIRMKLYLWNVIIRTGRKYTTFSCSRREQIGHEQEDHGRWALVALLNPQSIAILRKELGLPARIERRFLIEAARLQVGAFFFDPYCWENKVR